MANIALELNQNGGVEQLIPFSVKLSDFVLVEWDPVNFPGRGEYRATILPSVGSKYFIDKVFKPGARYTWNDMIEKATGEKLSPKHYAKQFVDMK